MAFEFPRWVYRGVNESKIVENQREFSAALANGWRMGVIPEPEPSAEPELGPIVEAELDPEIEPDEYTSEFSTKLVENVDKSEPTPPETIQRRGPGRPKKVN